MPISLAQCTDLKTFLDCNGVALPDGSQLLQCKDAATIVADNLCAALAALPTAGDAVPSTTLLVGADCQTYKLPAVAVDLNVTNFSVVGSDLVLTDQDGSQFKIPLDSLVRLNDCNGTPIDLANNGIATCTNVTQMIQTALQAPGAVDCQGAAIDLTTANLMTCADLPLELCDALKLFPFNSAAKPITAEILFLTDGAGGACTRGNIGTIAASFGTTDCAGNPLDLWQKSLAQCSDIAALQAQITAQATQIANLTTTINNILAALANTDTLLDCTGAVLATYVKG